MSLSITITDNFHSPISNIELLQKSDDDSTSSATNFFLRTGRPGHLFLSPNYTAYTKTSLGSIPSKIEKTLIKTDTNKPLSTNMTCSFLSYDTNKKLENLPENSDIKKYSTSFSSKGFGVGFVSKVNRFSDNLSAYAPGPADYSPDKNFTLMSKVEKSDFGKSLFKKQTSKSLNNINNYYMNNNSSKATSAKSNNDSEVSNNKAKKGCYFFESTTDRFIGSVFSNINKNPGPGKYNYEANNISVKFPDKLSPEFRSPTSKIINPIKYYNLNKNEFKQLGYHLYNNRKNGKVINIWNGFQYNPDDIIKNSSSLKSNIKFNNRSKSINNSKLSMLPTNTNTSNLPTLEFDTYKNISNMKNNCSQYVSLISEVNKSSGVKLCEESKKKFEKNMQKFKKKDLFTLSAPRWDQGLFHDNETHFQVPGPAYYAPKIQTTKKSFNLNKKDFIYTNSLPFKNGGSYNTSSVLI